MNVPTVSTQPSKKSELIRHISRFRALYIMLIPGMLFFLVFKYIPMGGSIIAFQNYNIFKGISGSEWVGLKWIEQFLTYPKLTRLISNTLIISFYQIIFAFPAPIILALLFNELKKMAFKRTVQTIVYLPHFLSWTIVFGFAYMILSVQTGILNSVIEWFGYEPINFLQKAQYFRTIIVASGIWKELGWSTIIFLAALSGINPSLYEAAKIDGASRWKQIVHISIPGILPAIMILLLLKIGSVLDSGVDQILIFLNPMTMSTGDVLDTYSYRMGILGGEYSLSTAIGLFKSVVGLMLLIIANKISKLTTGESLY